MRLMSVETLGTGKELERSLRTGLTKEKQCRCGGKADW